MAELEVGNKVRLEIRKQGINGEGIGYLNRLAIFVPGAIVKEVVDCEIVELYKTYATAKIVDLVRISTKRVEPPCKFFERCGGCQMQHIEYKEQLKIKLSIIRQALNRYTKLSDDEVVVKKMLGMDNTFWYRNKSQMPFKNTNFGLSLGLYAYGTNNFVYVDECMVQDRKVNEINRDCLSILRKYKLAAHDSMNPEGILLNLVTRYLPSSNKASVTFIVSEYDSVLKKVAADLLNKNSVVDSITYSVNKRSNPMMFGKTVELLAKKPYITDVFEGMKIKISPDAFHQLNSEQMIILYREIAKAAKLSGKEIVVDGYCGIGITTLLLAKNAKEVYGIDYSQASISDAKTNALENNIKNVHFFEDHVEGALPKILQSGVKPDILVLDPPRSGLHDTVMKAILGAKIPKVIYVSCNPSTLAKNLAYLTKAYDIEYIQPIDMFPHTSNVESLTVLNCKTD
ncbi:MAG: 23S rRNA (uracil(1939)-C(5))-methyltransferase RlmD [Bacilli bacterium]|nr:23S rRNA (uracil(1939)-C(5))-methyltransferase RlmD [Bacilli bacterium]MBN2696059.1 23S rRNA (uracil(1939)-C(5))-methyltransferase RlmD [Bacilli bacterium]